MEKAPPELRQTSQNTLEKGLSALLALSAAMPPSPSVDYIGSESCYDMVSSTDPIAAADDDGAVNAQSIHLRDRSRRRLLVKDREYPPLIPSLARTENLPSRMPWILRRLRTADGRLILREEKVRHHEYFKAHRSGGRLTLQLVPLDDDGFRLPVVDPDSDVENCEEEIQENDGGSETAAVEKEEETLKADVECKEKAAVGGGGGGDWKCNLYSTVSPNSPCLFGVAVPALGPVLGR